MLQKTTQKLWSTAYKINHDDRRGRFGVCRTETDHRWLGPRFMQLPHTSSSSSRREKYEPRARTKWRPQTSDLIGRLDRGRGVGVARTLWCALLGISPTCKHSAPLCLLLIAEIPSLLSMVSFFSCYQCLLSYSKLILDIFEGWIYIYLCVMVSTQFSYPILNFFLLHSLILYCLSSLPGHTKQGLSLTMRHYRSVWKVSNL